MTLHPLNPFRKPRSQRVPLSMLPRIVDTIADILDRGVSVFLDAHHAPLARCAPVAERLPDACLRLNVSDLARRLPDVREAMIEGCPVVVTVHRRPVFALVPLTWGV